MENIISKYNFECNRTIEADINEHMPTLKNTHQNVIVYLKQVFEDAYHLGD